MRVLFLLIISLVAVPVFSANNQSSHGTKNARAYLQKVIEQNLNYIDNKGSSFFAKKAKGQSPIVTLVSCSDSRVHTDIIDETPEGDLFMIRNIGNQVTPDLGSVMYGVNHLHSQILLIVGHSGCGAIQAASSDYSNLEPAIIKDLSSLHLPKGLSNIEGVKKNVHYQVQVSLTNFAELVAENKLLIVGAVYDFGNEMGKGAGKLNIINIQGNNVADK